jgi:N-carbamoyl-L-amino-acid hydrolase
MEAKPQRVLADLHALRAFGRYKTGVHRPTLSPQDMEARRWLVERLAEIGHEAHIDGIASVVGRAPGAGPKLLAGSHLESQNHAGWLDGALGVVFALEAARAAAEDGALAAAGTGVDVIAVADEEGHFGHFHGSRSFAGALSEADIDAARNRSDGRRLRDALADAGLDGVARAAFEAGRHRAFLEAHIEQGDRLEAEGLQVGIVSSIVAIWQYRITATGEQNHAGTTSMARRRDAGAALMRLFARIDAEFRQVAGPASVWTAGRMTFEPGAPSIVPGRAEMLFQFRDADRATLDRMEARLTALVAEADDAGPCAVTLDTLGRSEPAAMDAGVRAALCGAAERRAPGLWTEMPSGAGHDAQYMAPLLPTGMLFTPSIGGVSHHWTEDTREEDIALCAQVFVDAAAALLRAAR